MAQARNNLISAAAGLALGAAAAAGISPGSPELEIAKPARIHPPDPTAPQCDAALEKGKTLADCDALDLPDWAMTCRHYTRLGRWSTECMMAASDCAAWKACYRPEKWGKPAAAPNNPPGDPSTWVPPEPTP